MNRPIFLIGMPGAGKTTIGRKLAAALQKPFLDLDEYIEEKHGQHVRQIFGEKGEAFFREAEAAAVREVAARATSAVVATGGGTPCFGNNIDFMNEAGLTVFIKVPADALAERLSHSNQEQRPLVAGKTTEEIKQFVTVTLASRLQFYQKAQITYQNTSRDITKLIHLVQVMAKMC
ncbi:MAG: shikimate kinase [Cytophagales bacterium CG18_big_fil_WC_8_21_14_2_50_42_9]|nr:MAG: shikimate kinase [Cytophagales bacterium CG18_big_fil_WC_8_21_14_2_50_42_9]